MPDVNDLVQTVADMQACGMSATVLANKDGGIFNNGYIAIIKDLVFGLCIWDGAVWFPMVDLDASDRKIALDAVNAGTHPFPWPDDLAKFF